MTSAVLQTKPCPFCDETIQARAVKCRFCGEFLNTEKARALEAKAKAEAKAEVEADQDSQTPKDKETDNSILFAGRPSFWGMADTIVKGLYFLAFAGLLLKFPYEDLVSKLSNLELTENQVLAIGRYRILAGFAFSTIVMLVVSLKALKLKTVYYEVSAYRIERDRGILDRRVDNIDMSSVTDLKMHKSLLDSICDVGTIELVTTDKSNPKFVLEKVRDYRRLYYIIKKATLETDRKTDLAHSEQNYVPSSSKCKRKLWMDG